MKKGLVLCALTLLVLTVWTGAHEQADDLPITSTRLLGKSQSTVAPSGPEAVFASDPRAHVRGYFLPAANAGP